MKITSFVLLGQVTDKKEYEIIDSDERIEYKLTLEQLQFANKLRHIIDNYRRNALKFLRKHSTSSENHVRILKKLTQDKSVMITKADKGRCVVVLDRSDYVKQMESHKRQN